MTLQDCNHSNVAIREEFACWSVHDFSNGKVIDHVNDLSSGSYTGVITVECQDCGYRRRFSKRQKRPVWVQLLETQIGKAEDEIPHEKERSI